jgi:DNA-binding NarL/FixJ family response regulator
MPIELKIILLDDDVDDLDPLSDYLRIFDIENLSSTTDIDEAVAWATEDRTGKPLQGVVFVTDYHMGRFNGFDVMKMVLEINPIVMFVFISSIPTVPLLLEITTLGTGFYFLDKNEPDYYERVLRKIGKAKATIAGKMHRIIELENKRIEEEKRQKEILEAAANTLKILNRHGNTSI